MSEATRAAQPPSASLAEPAPTTARSGAWIIFLLSLSALFAAFDQQAFSVLLVPIQKDLKVSDAAMGALTGTSFAVVYAVLALPLARLADRTNRRNLLGVAVGLWSVATALCGIAGNYVQLLLARVAVAGGEAANAPTSMSLIGDLFRADRRGTAIGFTVVGTALGFSLGAASAGYLSDRYGWHIALLAVSLPGLILAGLIFLTLPEPPRGLHDGAAADVAAPSLLEAVKRCGRIRTLYPFAAGFTLLQMCFQGWLIWMPPFLMRVHHLKATEMGALFGVIIAGGAVGNLVSGQLSDRLSRRGARWRLYVCCAIVVVSLPLLTASSLIPGLAPTVACLIAYTLASGGLTTACTVTYVSLAPPSLRAVMTALMRALAMVVGGGTGPVLFGLVNDRLKPAFGDESLRYTLLLSPLMLALAGVLFFVASRTIERDTANLDPEVARRAT